MVAPKGPGRQRAAGTIDGLSSGWHTPSSSESEWSNVASEAVWPSAFLPRASKQAGRHHRTRREWRPTKLPLSSGHILLALYHSYLTVPKHQSSHFFFHVYSWGCFKGLDTNNWCPSLLLPCKVFKVTERALSRSRVYTIRFWGM